jgi:hypothetical protein
MPIVIGAEDKKPLKDSMLRQVHNGNKQY